MKVFVCLNIRAHIGRCTELGYLSVGHISLKMHSFIRKTSLFPFILVQETAVKLLINSSLHSMQNYFILQAFQASTE